MTGLHPQMFFLIIVVLLWLGTILGSHLRPRGPDRLEQEASVFKTLEGAVLALLGLLLGFTFSMAVNRYDLRKNLEVAEANDIGTTWLRTESLAEPARTEEQTLLRQYVRVRIAFLDGGSAQRRIDQSLVDAGVLQGSMWHIASAYTSTHSDPVTALFVSALNSTIDVTEERTAALENRIPLTAWLMLLFISFVGSALVGFDITSRSWLPRLVLPVVVAAAMSLILDLDSPRSGFIRIHQNSMERVAAQIEFARR